MLITDCAALKASKQDEGGGGGGGGGGISYVTRISYDLAYNQMKSGMFQNCILFILSSCLDSHYSRRA